MLNVERILKHDRLLRAMTELNRKAFEALLPTFTAIYERPSSTEEKPDKANLMYIIPEKPLDLPFLS